MSRSIHFFATRRDLESVLTVVESERPLQYVRTGLLDSPATLVVTSALQVPNLGIALHGDQVHESCYLVADVDTQVAIREVPQRKGGSLYAIDQKANPRTVALRPGGVFDTAAIIAGEVSTCTDDPISREMVNLFAREIRRQFKRIKSFFVGPEAEQLFDGGYRLTTSVKSPREIDLSRD